MSVFSAVKGLKQDCCGFQARLGFSKQIHIKKVSRADFRMKYQLLRVRHEV